MNVPAKLKSVDVTRFAQRAAQIESLKPAVAYWCYYWIVQQILKNNLHNADDATKSFTTNIVDKLEEMKLVYSADDAITDDVAGQAYVEQFGLETFQRAENAMQANKASKQTAETFLAAATFLELTNIWGAPSKEIGAKTKYAKFHALRIAKAVKAGEDPNLGNPTPDPAPAASTLDLDPNDPEVREIGGAGAKSVAESPPVAEEPASQPPADQFRAIAKARPGRAEVVWRPSGYREPTVTEENEERSVESNVQQWSTSSKTSEPSKPTAPNSNQPAASKGQTLTSLPAEATSAAEVQPQPRAQPDAEGRQGSTDGEYFPKVAPLEVPAQTQPATAPLAAAASPEGRAQPSILPIGADNPAGHHTGPANSHVAQQLSPLASPAPLQSPQPHPQASQQVYHQAADLQSSSPLPGQYHQQALIQQQVQSPPPAAFYQSPPPRDLAASQQAPPVPQWTYQQQSAPLPHQTTLPQSTPSPQPASLQQPASPPIQSQQPDVGQRSAQSPAPASVQQHAPSPQPYLPHQAIKPPHAVHGPTTPQQPMPYQQPPTNVSNQAVAYLTDDIAVLDAQKHAKWAISALNFEDVTTAVKELQEALKSLGAA